MTTAMFETPIVVRKRADKATRLNNEENGNSIWCMTTPDVDSDGETVDPAGLDFSRFDLNPCVLDNHSTDGSVTDAILGRVVRHWLDEVGEGTRWPQVGGQPRPAQLCEIAWNTATEKGREAMRMAHSSQLNGGSISFLPKGRPERNRAGGNHYPEVLVLEMTLTPVGANPSAIRLKRLNGGARVTKSNPSSTEHRGQHWYVRTKAITKGPRVRLLNGLQGEVIGMYRNGDVKVRDARGQVHDRLSQDDFTSMAGGFGIHVESLKALKAKSEDDYQDVEKILMNKDIFGGETLSIVRGPYAGMIAEVKQDQGAKLLVDIFDPDNSNRPPHRGMTIARTDTGPNRFRSLGKTMQLKRKLWHRGKSAWLLKSEGGVDGETAQYLQQRGLDDVRVEDGPPPEKDAPMWELEDKAEEVPPPAQKTDDYATAVTTALDPATSDDAIDEAMDAEGVPEEMKAAVKGIVKRRISKAAADANQQTSWSADDLQKAADDIAVRAKELMNCGADTAPAVEAAMKEADVPDEKRKAVKKTVLKTVRVSKAFYICYPSPGGERYWDGSKWVRDLTSAVKYGSRDEAQSALSDVGANGASVVEKAPPDDETFDAETGGFISPLTEPEKRVKDAMSDCVSHKIGVIAGDHPEMSEDQRIAVAFSMCGEHKSYSAIRSKAIGADRLIVLQEDA